MRIIYSEHAVLRMMQRNISVFDVHLIINSPDGKIQQSMDKWIFYKNFPKRKDNFIAAVTVESKNDSWEVVTVMIHFEVKK